MVDYQTLSILFAGLSIAASIVYYASVLRNSNKAQKLQHETRKIQLLLEFNKDKVEDEGRGSELLSEEWTDFNDWFNKYSQFKNPESYALRLKMWENFNVNGLLIRDGLIDLETYLEYMGDMPLVFWIKYEDIITELRRRFRYPTYMSGFEYLANEIEDYRNKQGWGPKIAPRDQFDDLL